MGKRGPGAAKLQKAARKPRRKTLPWRKRGLSRAGRVIAFLEFLPITTGLFAGTRLKLRDWQRDIIEGIYAPAHDDGSRVVRTALLTLPRKQGKTQLVAGLALCHLLGPEAEPRGQVYSAAADREQAALIFNEMVAMILETPELAARVNIKHFNRRIEDLETGSIYAALSADARKAHGLNTSFWAYDELAQARDRRLFDNLATSVGGRKEPLGIIISTQSPDARHVMSELVDYAVQVQDGMVDDPHFYPCVYSAPDDADPWDEATWRACNPALGDFRSLEEMQVAAERAKRIPTLETAFRNLYLNQRVETDERFISAADWNACDQLVDVDALEGRPCWGGLDLGSTKDLTAFTLYFPEDDGAVLAWFWVPGEQLQARAEMDHVPYPQWLRDGQIEATNGRATDRRAIAFRLAEAASKFDIRSIAFDRWRMDDLENVLADEGISLPLVPWGQGYRDMGPAVDALETRILNRELRHGDHPVLTWNAANAAVTTDPAGARKLAKDKSRERIDGLVALAMAVGLHARETKERTIEFEGSLVVSA